MTDYLIQVNFNVFAQVGVLILLLVYFFIHRKDPRHQTSGLSLLRTLVMVALFAFLLLNYASQITPGLRHASVVGMFLINLYMIWNVILTRLERPYRKALEVCTQAPGETAHLTAAWRAGKRFYSWHYFFQALLSGGSPGQFLKSVASHQVREDLQRSFQKHGVHQEFVSLRTLAVYLQKQLAQDETLPQDFKETMDKLVRDFASHPWIEEKVNQFLSTLLESPEELFYPGWFIVQGKVNQSPGSAVNR